jgi:hypothetical protein
MTCRGWGLVSVAVLFDGCHANIDPPDFKII